MYLRVLITRVAWWSIPQGVDNPGSMVGVPRGVYPGSMVGVPQGVYIPGYMPPTHHGVYTTYPP